jgi:hypothetical protein
MSANAAGTDGPRRIRSYAYSVVTDDPAPTGARERNCNGMLGRLVIRQAQPDIAEKVS